MVEVYAQANICLYTCALIAGRYDVALATHTMSSILTALSDIPVNKPTTPGTPGRKAVISRDDIIEAALKLAGPNRSVSTLSLREVAREAGIAPNSFYRQFRDMDELAVALIERG